VPLEREPDSEPMTDIEEPSNSTDVISQSVLIKSDWIQIPVRPTIRVKFVKQSSYNYSQSQ